jgi:hypothetical protein
LTGLKVIKNRRGYRNRGCCMGSKLSCCKAFMLLGGLLISSQSFTLGVGAANAETYIGENLSIHIPLFNVENPTACKLHLLKIPPLAVRS